MHTRMLGTSGLEVSAIGLGCMPMSAFYGVRDIPEAEAALELAIDLGVTFWDTAEVYGRGHNEELIGPVLRRNRDRIVIATKFGVLPNYVFTGTPEAAYAAIDGSLRRLQVDHIDLWYLHRVSTEVPIEDTIGAMADIVAQGKVRYIGLSEASAATLRRASAVHPIAALQSEWSLWTRDLEDDVLGVARELGIGLVPYSPLGRGFLTGAITNLSDMPETDHRQNTPRFSGDNFEHNKRLVEQFAAEATALGCTPGQLALAWLLAQGPDVVPIPGTKRRAYLTDNAGAADITLTAEQVQSLGDLMRGVAGGRYGRAHSYGDSPPKA